MDFFRIVQQFCVCEFLPSQYPSRKYICVMSRTVGIKYVAQNVTRGGGLLLHFAVLEGFLLFDIVLSDQEVSGSYENSPRKLRVHTL